MEVDHSLPLIKRTIRQMFANITSPQQIRLLKDDLLQLPLEEEQPSIETGVLGDRQAESQPYNGIE